MTTPTQPAHTPEPWHVGEPARYGQYADRFVIVGGNAGLAYLSARSDRYLPCQANAARIVSCVNALAGIPDPAAALKQAREALASADKLAIYVESRLASVAVPSGQPDVSGAFADIRLQLLSTVAERRAALRALGGAP